MKIVSPDLETLGKGSPGESHEGSKMCTYWQRLLMVLSQAWGPRAHAHLAPSLQAAHDFVIAFGDSRRRNERVPGVDTTHVHDVLP